MAKTKKTIAKSAVVEKLLAGAMDKLTEAHTKGDYAVGVRTKDGKKLTSAVKRLAKRRAALIKRKKTAANRLKKEANGDNRKALRAAVKDLATTNRELSGARKAKAANASELGPLKSIHRQLKAYTKLITQAEKALNKPKKKRKARKKAG